MQPRRSFCGKQINKCKMYDNDMGVCVCADDGGNVALD